MLQFDTEPRPDFGARQFHQLAYVFPVGAAEVNNKISVPFRDLRTAYFFAL